MKLNNKGFAITAVLYGLLILFVVLVSSYLVILSAKKDRVENLTDDIEENYNNGCKDLDVFLDDRDSYTIPYDGGYTFILPYYDLTEEYSCNIELEKGDVILMEMGSVYIQKDGKDVLLVFEESICNTVNNLSNYRGVDTIKYHCN